MIVPKGMEFLTAAQNRKSFFQLIANFFPTLDPRYKKIVEAYDDAKDASRGKHRDDGKTRYFEHVRGVVLIMVVYLRVKDHKKIIALLLHDVVEDNPSWTIDRVRNKYGEKVALMVEYMTKPPLSEYSSKAERDAVYHNRFKRARRRFFLKKLPDRLHNMLTLGNCSPEKQRRKIEETRTHYLPYAEKHFILYHELVEALDQCEKALAA